MADTGRARKIAERTKVLIASGLDSLVKDPRLGFVTVTEVRVTGDLQHATVFYTVLGGQEEREAAAEVLAAHRGRLRSHVGKGLGIRLTPSLEFVLDALPEDAAHLDEVMRLVHQRDAELAAARRAAAYAGDPDPYRKPHVEERDEPSGYSREVEAPPVDEREGDERES